MFREELYDHIERYLAGSMESQERSDFEARMAKEQDLAAEVALHRGLQAELGDSSKRNLREKLEKLSGEFTELEHPEAVVKPLQSNWRRVLSIAAAILLLGILIWLLAKGPDKAPEMVENPNPPQQEEEMNPGMPPMDPPEERIVEDQTPSLPENNDQTDPPQKPPMEMSDESLMAFEPNLSFEKLVGQLPPEEYSVSLESPVPGATLSLSDGRVDLVFNGLIETSLEEKNLRLRLLLFDNGAKAATSDTAIQAFEVALDAAESNNDEDEGFAFAAMDPYFFEMEQSLALAPGLYYYSLINPVLQSGAADQPLLVGKFMVKE
jgi:hypothetical protein